MAGPRGTYEALVKVAPDATMDVYWGPRRRRIRSYLPEARAAFDRAMSPEDVPGPLLFPAPKDAERPLGYDQARSYLRRAETRAGVEFPNGASWHAYRRAWATRRGGHSLRHVANAGGWATVRTLERCYQLGQTEGRREALLNGG